MKKTLGCLIALMAIAGFAQAQGIAQKLDIKSVGSTTIQPVVRAASRPFKKLSGIRVSSKGGGSSLGVKSTADGSAEIGMVSRKLKNSEPKDLVVTKIGIDGIAVIVNKENSVANFSKNQIVDIYTGEIKNWKDVGGADLSINLGSKAEGHSTKELFEKFFGILGKVDASAQMIESNQEVIAFVAGDPSAVGYVSIGTAEAHIGDGENIKMPALEGVTSSIDTVKDNTYPLTRPLNLVTKGVPAGAAKEFIDFLLSDEGQKIIVENEFVSVK